MLWLRGGQRVMKQDITGLPRVVDPLQARVNQLSCMVEIIPCPRCSRPQSRPPTRAASTPWA